MYVHTFKGPYVPSNFKYAHGKQSIQFSFLQALSLLHHHLDDWICSTAFYAIEGYSPRFFLALFHSYS